MVLEAIYEGSFEYTSHGFHPNRSCHTALTHIQKEFSGAKWFVEGDIKGFFDNINHDVLINILSERIADERFIRLIRKFLKAGYVEEWQFHNTFSCIAKVHTFSTESSFLPFVKFGYVFLYILIQLVKVYISQYRADDTPLRCATVSIVELPLLDISKRSLAVQNGL